MTVNVEQWRGIVNSEILRAGYPFPTDLILSLMRYESGGNPGIVNETSGASGLLQVMPSTLDHYNQRTGDRIPLSTLRSKTTNDGRLQIRVGLWVLGRYWRKAHRYLEQKNQGANIPLDDLARWADMFYAAGPAKVAKLAQSLYPATWSTWTSKYPTSKITQHADRVWTRTLKKRPTWNLTAVDRWVSGEPEKPPLIPHTPRNGFIMGVLILAAAAYLLNQTTGRKATT